MSTAAPALSPCAGRGRKITLAVERQYHAQGGRCHWCQAFTLPENLTRDHLHPRRNSQRRLHGPAWVLAHEHCNRSRGALTIGSTRFARWLRRVLRWDIRPFERRDKIRAALALVTP